MMGQCFLQATEQRWVPSGLCLGTGWWVTTAVYSIMVTGQTDLAHAGGHGKDQTQEPEDPGFSLGSASGTAWGVL